MTDARRLTPTLEDVDTLERTITARWAERLFSMNPPPR
jgi:hypothetical protein